MRPNADKVAAIIAEIAQAEIMPRFGALSPDEIKTKSTPNDLVTEVDEKTEAALKAALCALYPGSVFIGEEGVAADRHSAGSRAYIHGASGYEEARIQKVNFGRTLEIGRIIRD